MLWQPNTLQDVQRLTLWEVVLASDRHHGIAAWIQREEDELLYAPDCGPVRDVQTTAWPYTVRMLPDGQLVWPANDLLGLPMLDASEE